MAARGADKTDFQFPADRTLYFRTGSARNEVTAVPVLNEVSQTPIRINSEEQVAEALHQIDRIIQDWRVNKEVCS